MDFDDLLDDENILRSLLHDDLATLSEQAFYKQSAAQVDLNDPGIRTPMDPADTGEFTGNSLDFVAGIPGGIVGGILESGQALSGLTYPPSEAPVNEFGEMQGGVSDMTRQFGGDPNTDAAFMGQMASAAAPMAAQKLPGMVRSLTPPPGTTNMSIGPFRLTGDKKVRLQQLEAKRDAAARGETTMTPKEVEDYLALTNEAQDAWSASGVDPDQWGAQAKKWMAEKAQVESGALTRLRQESLTAQSQRDWDRLRDVLDDPNSLITLDELDYLDDLNRVNRDIEVNNVRWWDQERVRRNNVTGAELDELRGSDPARIAMAEDEFLRMENAIAERRDILKNSRFDLDPSEFPENYLDMTAGIDESIPEKFRGRYDPFGSEALNKMEVHLGEQWKPVGFFDDADDFYMSPWDEVDELTQRPTFDPSRPSPFAERFDENPFIRRGGSAWGEACSPNWARCGGHWGDNAAPERAY